MKLKLAILIAVLLTVLTVTTAFAQEAVNTEPDLTDLSQVLVWLAGAGAVYATNWLFGKLVEPWKVWAELPTSVKYIVPPVFAVAVAFGADALLINFPDIIDAVAPHWRLAVTIILGYFGSQVAHAQLKMPKG